MEVYSLPFGKVVCPICMDATYFETFRIAREIGADMVILPIAFGPGCRNHIYTV